MIKSIKTRSPDPTGEARPIDGRSAADTPRTAREQIWQAYLDCTLTRKETAILLGGVVLTILLQLGPVLNSGAALVVLGLMAVTCWMTPVTAFYYIACSQVLPFPESSPLNPAQVGFLTWPLILLVTRTRINFREWTVLWPFLPFLCWFAVFGDEGLELFTYRSEYVRALLYAFIALHYINEAKHQYMKCLLGLCLGAVAVISAYWAAALGLPVDLFEYEGYMERGGYERLGAGRADAVMVWPPLLMGAFGIVGMAITYSHLRVSKQKTRVIGGGAMVVFGLSIPPLVSTMTHSAYLGFAMMTCVGAFFLFRQLLSTGFAVRVKRRLMVYALVPLVGAGVLYHFDIMETKSRINGLWEHYQKTTQRSSLAASRTDVWTYSFRTIRKYPLFGIRITGDREEIPAQYRSEGGYLSHNVFLDYGRYSGIPGMLFVAFFFFYPPWTLWRCGRPWAYIPFFMAYFAMFIFWMSLSFQFYKTFWAMWMLTAVVAERHGAPVRGRRARAIRPRWRVSGGAACPPVPPVSRPRRPTHMSPDPDTILPDCTIVIPTRDRPDDLRETAAKLVEIGLRQTPVIIVDDASEDGAGIRESVTALGCCRVIRQERRTGQAKARNTGLAAAETGYILFLDDDAHLEALPPLLEFLAQPQAEDVAAWRFETIREYDGYRDGIPETMAAGPLHTFIGFGVLMHRERVLRVKGYRDYFCYRCEEDDLAMRLLRAGYRILYQPGVRFIHRHSGVARSDREYDYLSVRNIFLLYALNYPLPLAPFWGGLKALSVIVKLRTHPVARVAGLLNGMLTWLLKIADWTPFSWRQWAAYRQLRQDVARRTAECEA